jgi:ubiquinone/menaquinone biosynthesis C-methylase UbiE
VNGHLADQFSAVAEAFSRKAAVYDSFGEAHPNLDRMRQRVYAHIESIVPPGSYLLELNAGTGLDAAALVRRGYRIHATDIAPGMVSEIAAKIDRWNLAESLTVQQCSFAELDQVAAGPFDAVYSNFGGLNCIPYAGLVQVAGSLSRLLRPGGALICVIMPPVCLWELARIAQDFRTATRRLRRSVPSRVEGVEFTTTYFTPREVRSAFGPSFHAIRLEGLSVLTPPADNKTFALRRPRLYRVLARLDDALAGRWPFRAWGDFFILSMRHAS